MSLFEISLANDNCNLAQDVNNSGPSSQHTVLLLKVQVGGCWRVRVASAATVKQSEYLRSLAVTLQSGTSGKDVASSIMPALALLQDQTRPVTSKNA